MKLIVRADDFGYTAIYNAGTLRALEDGVVTSLDIMLDTPGTDDALEIAKRFPWVSLGWHAHFWGSPVLGAERVPSMVDERGRFAFGRKPELRSRVAFGEALAECRAQMERCMLVLGRVPDTAWVRDDGTALEAARRQVCEEYGIAMNFAAKPDRGGNVVPAEEPWKTLDIYMPNQPAGYYQVCYEDSYARRCEYNPVDYYVSDYDHLLERSTVLTAWHPGYLDDYIMAESRMRECRVVDVAALTSSRLKDWIVQEGVELVNTRDALFGTHEYQNHLRAIGSPLYVGNRSHI